MRKPPSVGFTAVGGNLPSFTEQAKRQLELGLPGWTSFAQNLPVIPAEPTGPRKARPDDKLRESRNPAFWKPGVTSAKPAQPAAAAGVRKAVNMLNPPLTRRHYAAAGWGPHAAIPRVAS